MYNNYIVFFNFHKIYWVIYLKVIKIEEYNSNMGKLICVDPKELYLQHHIVGSINIPYETLLYNRDRILNKEETYYIYCHGGHKSKRAVNVLEIYGFKVVQVIVNK